MDIHVRNAVGSAYLLTVFMPQQRQRHALLCKVLMNLRKVRHRIRGSICVLPRKQDLLQIRIGDILIQRPGDALFMSSLQRILDWLGEITKISV